MEKSRQSRVWEWDLQAVTCLVPAGRKPSSDELEQNWTIKSFLWQRWERVSAKEMLESRDKEPRRKMWKGWKANQRYRAG